MRKISDYKNEEALELVVDLIEPVGRLFADQEFVKAVQAGKRLQAVKLAISNHKKDIILVLARLNDQTVEEYKGNIVTMTAQLIEIMNDEELSDFFISQDLMRGEDASSEPMESTQEKES